MTTTAHSSPLTATELAAVRADFPLLERTVVVVIMSPRSASAVGQAVAVAFAPTYLS